MGQDFNLWGFSFSRTKVILVLNHCHKPEEQQRGFLHLFFFQTYLRHWEGTVIFNVLEKEWEGGSAKAARIAEIAACPASKEKITILIKERALEKNTPISYFVLKFLFTLSEVGAMVYVCKDGKTSSVHLFLCLLLLKIASSRLKHPVLSWFLMKR